MNSLSWMLYLADAGGSLAATFLFVGVVMSLLAALWLYGRVVEDAETFPPKILYLGAVSVFLLAALIPSRDTVYAIAASEMGEEALKSKTATKAMQALDKWLDKQIEGNVK